MSEVPANWDLAVTRRLGDGFDVEALPGVVLYAAHHHQRHVARLGVFLDLGDNILGAQGSLALPRLKLNQCFLRVEAVELDLALKHMHVRGERLGLH
eukprot:CAMPEP_0119529040 /NCGR_PEP_ID=MMETSP1344-20130328/43119_1 /TAXON_ID=236787 /ORGANISM="Florenciella parvula, Strain CCMP2471" /LENGTH=96 /DNA_ID=CAMNT_0007568573 /DNA_START=65 /DNA_END=355 /DNA_ORIENTATION=-